MILDLKCTPGLYNYARKCTLMCVDSDVVQGRYAYFLAVFVVGPKPWVVGFSFAMNWVVICRKARRI